MPNLRISSQTKLVNALTKDYIVAGNGEMWIFYKQMPQDLHGKQKIFGYKNYRFIGFDTFESRNPPSLPLFDTLQNTILVENYEENRITFISHHERDSQDNIYQMELDKDKCTFAPKKNLPMLTSLEGKSTEHSIKIKIVNSDDGKFHFKEHQFYGPKPIYVPTFFEKIEPYLLVVIIPLGILICLACLMGVFLFAKSRRTRSKTLKSLRQSSVTQGDGYFDEDTFVTEASGGQWLSSEAEDDNDTRVRGFGSTISGRSRDSEEYYQTEGGSDFKRHENKRKTNAEGFRNVKSTKTLPRA